MKFNIEFLIGVAWIFFMTGFAFESIGKLPTCNPFEWHIPIVVFVALASPFILGYLAGRES